MSPFRPSGERARWRILYELLLGLEVEDVIEYETMGDAINLDPDKQRHQIQMAVQRAGREYLEVDKRALEVIPNVGYRIVRAPEHLRLADKHQRKAGRSLQRGHSTVVNVDFNLIDGETRRAFEVVGRAFAMQMDFNRRMAYRQGQTEKALRDVTNRTERTDAELADLRARLERLERDMGTAS